MDEDKVQEQMMNELIELRKRVAEIEASEALRKRVEEALGVSEGRYRLLADNVTDVIWTMDMNLRFTYVSPSVTLLRGYSAEETITQTLTEVLTAASFKIAMKTLAEELAIENMEQKDLSRSRTLELEQRCKDGSTVWSETKMNFLRDPNGQAVGILGVTRDITERKRAEEQLQHAQLLASLGEMTAGIAHEVNNPLGSVLLYSELLMASDVPSQIKKDLRIIHDEAKRATRIMTALLTYSYGISSKVRRFDLRGILNKVLEMRRYAEKMQNISVSTNLLNYPLYVKGNSSQLTQVFINLMLNAEEALRESDGGNIVITTETSGKWVKVSIADNGTGIPEENLDRVFHPFFTTRQVGEGTGLGLSSCYGIVTGHNGLIRAENNEMGGATFTVELPLAEVREKEAHQG